MADYVIVGKVRRAHGVRGAWAVESLSAAPDVILTSGAVIYAGDRKGNLEGGDSASARLHIEDGRPMNNDWLVRVKEVTDRDVADAWRGRYLLADTADMPEPDDDEMYIFSLIGMQVEFDGQGHVGEVRDVYDAPQGLIIEVETATGRPLVPWRPEIIERVDEERNTIVLKPLDGLLDS
jgi:16S rRNA processing protein RimM